MSINSFSKSIGCSPDTISQALRKNTDIQSKWVSVIAVNYSNLDIRWLLTGEGEMLKQEGEKGVVDEKKHIATEKFLRELLAAKDEMIAAKEEMIVAKEEVIAAKDETIESLREQKRKAEIELEKSAFRTARLVDTVDTQNVASENMQDRPVSEATGRAKDNQAGKN